MALDTNTQETITKFINEKWRNKACQLCGEHTWLLHGFIVLPMGNQPRGFTLGGQSLPCVAMVCQNCGNTHFVNAVIAGAVCP